jgi:hypothetical protein
VAGKRKANRARASAPEPVSEGSTALEVRRVPPQHVRVGRILGYMKSLEWCQAVKDRLIAEWGCSPFTLNDDAQQAATYLKLAQEPEALREAAVAKLLSIADESEHDRVPAIRTALEAAGQLRQKVEVSGQFSSVPTTELARELLKLKWFQELLAAEGWIAPRVLVETTGEEA